MPAGQVVQAELGYGEIYRTITREIADPVQPASGKTGGLNIGVIHLEMVSDGEAARGPPFRQAGAGESASAAAQEAGAHQTGVRHRSSQKVEWVTLNALHHAANQIMTFCVDHQVTGLYTGDLGTVNQHRRHRRS